MPAGQKVLLDSVVSAELPRAIQTADQVLRHRQLLHILLLRTFPHADAVPKAGFEATRHNLESEVLGTATYDWREARALLYNAFEERSHMLEQFFDCMQFAVVLGM